MNIYRDAALQATERRVTLQREAEQDRLAQMAQTGGQNAADRVLASVGEWMIASGKRLKQRSEYRVMNTEYPVPSV